MRRTTTQHKSSEVHATGQSHQVIATGLSHQWIPTHADCTSCCCHSLGRLYLIADPVPRRLVPHTTRNETDDDATQEQRGACDGSITSGDCDGSIASMDPDARGLYELLLSLTRALVFDRRPRSSSFGPPYDEE